MVEEGPQVTSKDFDNWQASLASEQRVMGRMIYDALADQQWEYRTIDGICRDTQLPEDQVKSVLMSCPEVIYKSRIPDHRGRDLYSLRTRHSLFRSLGKTVASLGLYILSKNRSDSP